VNGELEGIWKEAAAYLGVYYSSGGRILCLVV
jgi:hypothetical protein